MFEILENTLPGVYLLSMLDLRDHRGRFVKSFNTDSFTSLGLAFSVAESFYSISSRDTLRGMHFQTGASAHSKLVYCSSGSVLDVVVGINPALPSFNRPYSVELSSEKGNCLLIAKGYAHGFISLCDDSIVNYLTSTVYSPRDDLGVLWSSIDFEWPVMTPILSSRDASHPPITSFS